MTRNIIRGLLLLSMISLMSGCTDRGKLNPLGWERISPEADSLTLAIERTINNDESADSAEILLSKLRRVADTLSYTGNLNARLVLFETGILGLRHKSKEAFRTTELFHQNKRQCKPCCQSDLSVTKISRGG